MDTRDHLRELISHYELLIRSAQSQDHPLHQYIDYIEELKYVCSKHLDKIREVDMEAQIGASAFAGLFHTTNLS